MSSDEKEKMNRGKSWCFDNGVSEDKIQGSWDNALQSGNMIIKNHDKHGRKWWCLPEHLLQQLIERY
ncbi:hypothetical protein R50345_05880 [Paenibacillus sp. FSL R5-0345]|uniref:hypothetical protein n=1 Tax=Paenibacillus sp. FSL R5-0345 TaxID=1536770 RepID=UPI0004F7D4AD|nr:hypothetical protein [Paenibacillus sp. FSL R5-0345]AIQ34199.1 hypothetical protein R50345_05880 [Paenibacillus sp. FSL R5-0345]